MKGFMRQLLLMTVAATGLTTGVGCLGGERYRELVDPCYPQRYNAQARAEVVASFAPQVQNGHILDQTLWNYHFEPGSAKLHPGGMDKITYLIRRRPMPDGRIFLQTAHDITYDQAAPAEQFVNARRDLDYERKLAVEKYITAQTAGRPLDFEILVHDPAETGQFADAALLSMRRHTSSSTGTLNTSGGFGGGSMGSGGGAGGIGGGSSGGQGGYSGGGSTGGTTGGSTGSGSSGTRN